MIKSKGWDWTIVKEDKDCVWKNPSIESFYLVNRWLSQGKKDFLDLGCGLGRHAILFGKHGFNVYCNDISEDSIKKTEKWAKEEGLEFDYKVGDMLDLPYENEQFDCMLGYNVITHTDTEGIKKVIKEIHRVLRKNGECYVTLCSKDTWGFKRTDWPSVDENTKLLMDEGPEYKVPHFYADYGLVKELFKDFEIIKIYQVVNYFDHVDYVNDSYHFHVLVRKK